MNQETLTKALRQAQQNGWDKFNSFRPTERVRVDNALNVTIEDNITIGHYNYQTIIFDHDFAKALWGEDTKADVQLGISEWRWHLKNMVVADDPIKYLGEHL